ncbi:MAG: DUF445 domain-containing protein [Betaproteobacteria bacterium]
MTAHAAPARRLPDSALAKDVRLARIKAAATGLLILVAVLYVAATLLTHRYPMFAYLAATCEAAMVGALADWFAVVALFRHPLGVPLPHTAIIPKNKARIAQGLGEFIQEQFLSTPALLAKIREFDPARQLSRFVLRPDSADFIAGYFARALAHGVGALDDARVRDFLHHALSTKLATLDVATHAASVLDILTENRRHHALLDQALGAVRELLGRDETREFLRNEIARQVPGPKWVNQVIHLDERAARRLLDAAIERLGEVLDDPGHELRHRFDRVFGEFIARLREDPALRAKSAQLRDELLANPALADYVDGLWREFRAWLDHDLGRPESTIRRRVARFAATLGARLDADAGMRAWINEQVVAAAPPFVETHRAAFGHFIERQINEWQDKTLVRELERNIGPDLQYIRINGTLVGGAAGLIIYSATRFLSGGSHVG